MIVNATDFKNKVGKYITVAVKEDVIITKNGRQVVKLVAINKNSTPITNNLIGAIKNASQIDVEKEREERLSQK
jgi:prevent-host-death family protein